MKAHLAKYQTDINLISEAHISTNIVAFSQLYAAIPDEHKVALAALFFNMTHQHAEVLAMSRVLAKPDSSIDKNDMTKLEQAFSIYDRLRSTGISRTDIIERIMATLTMSRAGASSYYAQAQKRAVVLDAAID